MYNQTQPYSNISTHFFKQQFFTSFLFIPHSSFSMAVTQVDTDQSKMLLVNTKTLVPLLEFVSFSFFTNVTLYLVSQALISLVSQPYCMFMLNIPHQLKLLCPLFCLSSLFRHALPSPPYCPAFSPLFGSSSFFHYLPHFLPSFHLH